MSIYTTCFQLSASTWEAAWQSWLHPVSKAITLLPHSDKNWMVTVLSTMFTVPFLPPGDHGPLSLTSLFRSAQISFHIIFLHRFHLFISWCPRLHFLSSLKTSAAGVWVSAEINSQKHSGNVAFTPFSPEETLQENIKQRNSHILHFCSREDLKALHKQLTNPSAFNGLPVLMLMKRHQH